VKNDNSAPNSKHTIDYLIKGIKKYSSIYARLGLYKVTNRESIKYFLEKISKDNDFLKSYLNKESIIDKEDGCLQLIENIQKNLDKNILTLLKKTIFKIFRIPNYYQESESNFINQIIQLINQEDKNFLFEILEEIKELEDEIKVCYLFFRYEKTLALLLKPNNISHYFKKIKKFPKKVQDRADSVVYIAKQINGERGKDVYNKAVNLKFVEPVDEKAANFNWEQQQLKRKQEIYKDFLDLLEPSSGKYGIKVFQYFLQHRKEIEEQWDDKNKKRLIKLAVEDNIRRIDPKDFKVNIPDKKIRKFNLSSVAFHYGDILSVVKILAPKEIEKHRQEIINFIPYAFSDDMNLIIDLIEEIKDKDLVFVNKVMSDKKDDRRYLVPGTYIYLIGHYIKKGCRLQNVKPIIKSFIGDKYIPDYEQESALELLHLFIDDSDIEIKEFLKNIFNDEEANGQKMNLAKAANAALITIFKDDKAIDWRFDQIKKPLKFDHHKLEGIAHFVGPEENEFDTLAFAKPIIELKDEEYLDKLFGLLEYSFMILKDKRLQEKKEYWGYVNYLWRITVEYVKNLKDNGSFKPFLALKEWISKYSYYENFNWLLVRIFELRKVYINSISKIDFKNVL
jgi:hypothetical protein